jgi:hypothetical protein
MGRDKRESKKYGRGCKDCERGGVDVIPKLCFGIKILI